MEFVLNRETSQLTEEFLLVGEGEEMDGFNVSLATFILAAEGCEAWESESEATSSSDSCKTCNLQRKNRNKIKSLVQPPNYLAEHLRE